MSGINILGHDTLHTEPQIENNNDQDRIFESFCLIGSQNGDNTASLLYSYPKVPSIDNLPYIIAPDGIISYLTEGSIRDITDQLKYRSVDDRIREKGLVILFCTGNGEKIYAIIVPMLELEEESPSFVKCSGRRQFLTTRYYCILSKYPFCALHNQCLSEIIKSEYLVRSEHTDITEVPLTLEKQLANYLSTAILSPGNLITAKIESTITYTVPTIEEALIESGICVLFRILPVEILIRLYKAILCEHSLLIISDNLEILSRVILGITLICYPIEWVGNIITCIPPSLIDCISSPCPIIVGCKQIPDNIQELEQTSIFDTLDLTNNTLRIDAKSKPLPSLPREAELFSEVAPYLMSGKNTEKESAIKAYKKIRQCTIDILDKMQSLIPSTNFSLDQSISKDILCEGLDAAYRPICEVIIRTQMYIELKDKENKIRDNIDSIASSTSSLSTYTSSSTSVIHGRPRKQSIAPLDTKELLRILNASDTGKIQRPQSVTELSSNTPPSSPLIPKLALSGDRLTAASKKSSKGLFGSSGSLASLNSTGSPTLARQIADEPGILSTSPPSTPALPSGRQRTGSISLLPEHMQSPRRARANTLVPGFSPRSNTPITRPMSHTDATPVTMRDGDIKVLTPRYQTIEHSTNDQQQTAILSPRNEQINHIRNDNEQQQATKQTQIILKVPGVHLTVNHTTTSPSPPWQGGASNATHNGNPNSVEIDARNEPYNIHGTILAPLQTDSPKHVGERDNYRTTSLVAPGSSPRFSTPTRDAETNNRDSPSPRPDSKSLLSKLKFLGSSPRKNSSTK